MSRDPHHLRFFEGNKRPYDEEENDRYSYEDKVASLVEWIDEDAPDDFDGGFIYDLQEKLEGGAELSSRQEQAVDNIIRGFKIRVAEWLPE